MQPAAETNTPDRQQRQEGDRCNRQSAGLEILTLAALVAIGYSGRRPVAANGEIPGFGVISIVWATAGPVSIVAATVAAMSDQERRKSVARNRRSSTVTLRHSRQRPIMGHTCGSVFVRLEFKAGQAIRGMRGLFIARRRPRLGGDTLESEGATVGCPGFMPPPAGCANTRRSQRAVSSECGPADASVAPTDASEAVFLLCTGHIYLEHFRSPAADSSLCHFDDKSPGHARSRFVRECASDRLTECISG